MMNPGYYAIIPANVRYDRHLKANEKLLYAELTSLSQKDGCCWAGNGYFAELYGVSPETVSRWISNLQKCGYIRVEVKPEKGNERKIYIIPADTSCAKNQEVLTKTSRGHDKNVKTPIDENVKQNNTSINNKSNNKKEQYKGRSRPGVPAEPDDRLKLYHEIISYLNQKAGTSYRDSSRATRRHIGARLSEGYTLEDFQRVIDIKVSDWGRPPGQGEKDMRPYLRPETLFGPKFEAYLNQRKDGKTHGTGGADKSDPSRFGGTWC